MNPGPIHEGFDRASTRFGDRPAILSGQQWWSFRQIEALSNSFARRLAAAGVQGGRRVVVMTANRLEFVLAVNAISKLGAASVLLSPAWKPRDVEHALEVTVPSHAVADSESASLLRVCLGRENVTDVDDLPGASDSFPHGDRRLDAFEIDPTADAVLVFSSGTTGLPKAVRHTHLSLAGTWFLYMSGGSITWSSMLTRIMSSLRMSLLLGASG
jgi:long-chain acyl-CoA synthetase